MSLIDAGISSLPCWGCGCQTELTAESFAEILRERKLPLGPACFANVDLPVMEAQRTVFRRLMSTDVAIAALASYTPAQFAAEINRVIAELSLEEIARDAGAINFDFGKKHRGRRVRRPCNRLGNASCA